VQISLPSPPSHARSLSSDLTSLAHRHKWTHGYDCCRSILESLPGYMSTNGATAGLACDTRTQQATTARFFLGRALLRPKFSAALSASSPTCPSHDEAINLPCVGIVGKLCSFSHCHLPPHPPDNLPCYPHAFCISVGFKNFRSQPIATASAPSLPDAATNHCCPSKEPQSAIYPVSLCLCRFAILSSPVPPHLRAAGNLPTTTLQ
jgi:hypothetical protein